MSYGAKTNLGICFQNSYGTALTNSIHWIPFLSEGVGLKKDQLVSENMRGVFDEGANYEGPNSVEGDIECEAHPISLGVLLKAALGSPTTVTSTGVRTHTFKPATSDFDDYSAGRPFTVVKDLGDTGSAQLFYDLNGTKLSLSIANGEFLKATLSVLGGKHTQIAAPAASYPAGNLLAWDVTSVSLDGAANGDMTELNLELDNSYENKYTLNASKTPSRTKRSGFRTLSVGGTLVFDNQTEFQKFLSQAERALIVHMKTGVEVQSGYFEALTLKVPLVRHTEFMPAAEGPGKTEVSFTSKGAYSVTSATALEVVLVNTQVSY